MLYFIMLTLADNTIDLKVDLNKLRRINSFEYSSLAIVDPEKAATSELNKMNLQIGY